MPTYDYICDACEHSWELFQKITDDPVKKCPECGKKKAVRQFGDVDQAILVNADIDKGAKLGNVGNATLQHHAPL